MKKKIVTGKTVESKKGYLMIQQAGLCQSVEEGANDGAVSTAYMLKLQATEPVEHV